MHASGLLRGIELFLFADERPLSAIEQECREVFSHAPLSAAEQQRLQRLIDAVADGRGISERERRRRVAFTVIRMFVLSDEAARGMPGACWAALVDGMFAGEDKAASLELSVRRLSRRRACSRLVDARETDVVQQVIPSDKSAVLPADADGSFAWALAACEAACNDPETSDAQRRAIEAMSSSYTLPLVLAYAQGMLSLSAEGDGMSEPEMVRRVADALLLRVREQAHSEAASKAFLTYVQAPVTYDASQGVTGDWSSTILYGIWWLAGYGSATIGWVWDRPKARRHHDAMFGESDASWSLRGMGRKQDMRDGYDDGWLAAEKARSRVHRLTTSKDLSSLESGFASRCIPVARRLDALGFAALFLCLPMAGPATPWLLP